MRKHSFICQWLRWLSCARIIILNLKLMKVKFFKDATHGTVRAGLLGATQLNATEIERLSTLPAREQLLAQLVGQLQGPLYGLHNALSWNIRKLVWTLGAVKSKKSN